MVLLERFAGHLRERDPARGGVWRKDRTLQVAEWRCLGNGVERHDHDWALADADCAPDALPYLDRVLHHPGQRHTARRRLDPWLLRAAHVERLDRADVHADAAVDAVVVIDRNPIAHGIPSLLAVLSHRVVARAGSANTPSDGTPPALPGGPSGPIGPGHMAGRSLSGEPPRRMFRIGRHQPLAC